MPSPSSIALIRELAFLTGHTGHYVRCVGFSLDDRNGLGVDPFVAAVVGGGAQQIPEPSTLLLCLIALALVGGWRKWHG